MKNIKAEVKEIFNIDTKIKSIVVVYEDYYRVYISEKRKPTNKYDIRYI